jgi:Co/Zn/Cd efflux system component
MQQSIFHIRDMDCPSEEQLIRMGLGELSGIQQLHFDLSERQLTVWHDTPVEPIEKKLDRLKLGSQLTQTAYVEAVPVDSVENVTQQSRLLWTVLGINFAFFVLEMTTGLLSRSMGLVADSLDMLADAFVYGISLLAVGGSIVRKKRVAKLAGYFQLTLAVLGFMEVVRRFLGYDKMPDFSTMMIVSFLALLANGYCLYLLQRSRSREAHMQASMIFTSNDIIINLGVILAGGLVWWTATAWPDLVVGSTVFVLVLRGAIRILKLG